MPGTALATSGRLDDAALHAEHAIHHYHAAAIGVELAENTFQVCHVVVAEFEGLAEGQAAGVENAGVVLAVGK